MDGGLSAAVFHKTEEAARTHRKNKCPDKPPEKPEDRRTRRETSISAMSPNPNFSLRAVSIPVPGFPHRGCFPGLRSLSPSVLASVSGNCSQAGIFRTENPVSQASHAPKHPVPHKSPRPSPSYTPPSPPTVPKTDPPSGKSAHCGCNGFPEESLAPSKYPAQG